MKNKQIFFIIIFMSLTLSVCTLRRGHDWGDDFASYIMQAQSIIDASMQNFVDHHTFTISNSSILIGPVAYPWGYPLALVPALLLRGTHPLVLKLPGILFFIGFLVCFYFLMKPRLTRTESLLLVSLFAFNPMLINFTDQILSDIPFLFFSTLALTLMLSETRYTMKGSLLLGLAIACAFFIRTQGILLLAAYLLLELLSGWKHKQDRDTLRRIGSGLLWVLTGFGSVWIWIALIFPGGGESYFAQYSAFSFNTALEYIGSYFTVFSEFFGAGIVWQIIYYILFVFFLIGAWARRKQETIFIVFFTVWMLFLITWPYWQGSRFIFPLLPIFVYFVFWGVKTGIEKLPLKYRSNGQTAAHIFFFGIALAFLWTSSMNAYNNLKENRDIAGPFDPYSDELFNFIKEETPADSVVIFFKPRAMRMFTQRDSLMALECERLTLGDYVALHKKWDNSQIPPDQIDECGYSLQVVFENRRFIVYEIMQ